MNDLDNARARAEALRSAPAMSSADRARFWAGLNRYVAAEAQIVRSTPAHDEDEGEPDPLSPTELSDADRSL